MPFFQKLHKIPRKSFDLFTGDRLCVLLSKCEKLALLSLHFTALFWVLLCSCSLFIYFLFRRKANVHPIMPHCIQTLATCKLSLLNIQQNEDFPLVTVLEQQRQQQTLLCGYHKLSDSLFHFWMFFFFFSGVS